MPTITMSSAESTFADWYTNTPKTPKIPNTIESPEKAYQKKPEKIAEKTVGKNFLSPRQRFSQKPSSTLSKTRSSYFSSVSQPYSGSHSKARPALPKPKKAFPFCDSQGRDLLLCALILFLAFGGFLCLQSISSSIAQRTYQDPAYFVKKQALWLLLGLGGMLLFASVRLELIRRAATGGMLLAIFLLLLVFAPGLGKSVSSSHGSFERWLNLGIFTIQPSEFSKIALVVFLAYVLSQEKTGSIYALLKPALLVGTMLLAILFEPQYGTSLCMLGVVFLMVYMAGFSALRLLSLALAFLPLLGILLVFWPYRLERLYVWLNPYQYRFEGGYQLVTSYRAFQEGSWLGGDLAYGLAHRYLTYGHTDFALALFAEDFGWIGVCFLLLTLGLFMWRSLFLLRKVSHEPFVCLLGSGALLMLMSQSVLNLFVVTGLVPTTGIGLPFLSYGGSSLITSLCLCGLLLNASRR